VSASTEAAPARSRWRVSPRTFTLLAGLSAIAAALIILSGGAVRLTGSGLGCPDWPQCYAHQLTPASSIHPIVEFTNRMITGLISVVVICTVIAAYRRRGRRSDLIWLSWGLVGGLVAESLLGAIVVYTKLNPYTVMVHFLLTPLWLADALILLHRSTRRYDLPGVALVAPKIRTGSRVLLALTVVVMAAGTAVTNAGPHAGNSSGQQVARRLPIALSTAVVPHAILATALLALVIWLVVATERAGAAPVVRTIGRRLLVVVVLQCLIGVLQYASHLPAMLVELHLLGAASVTVGVLRFNFTTVHRELEDWAVARQGASELQPV